MAQPISSYIVAGAWPLQTPCRIVFRKFRCNVITNASSCNLSNAGLVLFQANAVSFGLCFCLPTRIIGCRVASADFCLGRRGLSWCDWLLRIGCCVDQFTSIRCSMASERKHRSLMLTFHRHADPTMWPFSCNLQFE